MNKNQGNGMLYHLSQEEKRQMLEDIKYYFKEERDEDLGILASESILEFFLKDLGNRIYNKALDDTKLWFSRQMDNLESDYYALYKS